MKTHSIAASVFAVMIGTWLAIAAPALVGQQAANAPTRNWANDLPMKITAPFTLASVGDLMIVRPVGVYEDPGLQAVLKLVRDSDLGIGNFESNIRDERTFAGPLAGVNGTKEVAADIRTMGFRLLGRANDHVLDSDLDGMYATNDLLEAAGLGVAGSGRNLDEARAARLLEIKKGRVGFVAIHTPNNPYASNGFTNIIASHQIGNIGGRPGLNMLPLTQTITVSAEQLAGMKKIRDAIFMRRSEYSIPVAAPSEPADELQLFGVQYKVGPHPGMNTFAMNQTDYKEILESVKNAKEYSHFVVATIHAHQNASDLQRADFGDAPPDFLTTLAHGTIDSGADAFMATGPHTLRGIEIYKGKPIFYGLGTFFQDLYWTMQPFTARPGMTNAEAAARVWDGAFGDEVARSLNMQGMVAISKYDKGQLEEVRLYPTDLSGALIADIGRPRLASPALAKTILKRLQKLSTPFGTTIAIEGSAGVIRMPPPATTARGPGAIAR